MPEDDRTEANTERPSPLAQLDNVIDKSAEAAGIPEIGNRLKNDIAQTLDRWKTKVNNSPLSALDLLASYTREPKRHDPPPGFVFDYKGDPKVLLEEVEVHRAQMIKGHQDATPGKIKEFQTAMLSELGILNQGQTIRELQGDLILNPASREGYNKDRNSLEAETNIDGISVYLNFDEVDGAPLVSLLADAKTIAIAIETSNLNPN